MLKLLRKFARGAGGMAAVEFALIAPVMMVLFFGLVELCSALNAHQKVTSVASTAADLVGQAKTLTAGDLDDVFAASSAIMTPFSGNDMSIVITSIGGSGRRNIGTVLWSVTNGHGTAHNVGDTITVGNPDELGDGDTGLLPADCESGAQCSLILAEVSYNYTSSYARVITGDLPMTDTFYTKPRRVVAVACNQCGG
jgi:Flp pilus assembly protein TadG